MSHSPDRDLLNACYGVGGVHCACCRPRAVSSPGGRRRRRRTARLVSRIARTRAADFVRRDLRADG